MASLRELPEEVLEVFDRALVCEFSVISDKGRPITHPLLPIYDPGEGRLYVTSSVLFSKKLGHIKKNPKVGVLFSNKAALRVTPYRIVLVKGVAKVIEDDIHHGWEKLLPLWRRKEPYIDRYVKMRYALPLFWERSIMEIIPSNVHTWLDGNPNSRPNVYELS